MLRLVMKHAFFLTVLLCISDIFVFSQSQDEIKIRDVLSDFEILRTFPERIEGSDGEVRTLEYLKDGIGSHARLTEFDFGDAERFHSFSKILQATVPGRSENVLLIAVPLNVPIRSTGEYDGTINLALAIGLINRYAEHRPEVTLQVVFIGADTPLGNADGTVFYLKNLLPENPTAVVYLSFTDFPAKILFRNGGNGYVTPSGLVENYSSAAKSAGLPFTTYGNEIQALRIALPEKETAVGSFLEAGIPAVAMESAVRGTDVGMDSAEWVGAVLNFLDGFVRQDPSGYTGEWDRHYLLFQIRSFVFLVSEGRYIGVFITVLLAFLVFGLIRLKQIRKYMSLLFRNFWNLPVQYLLIFVFLFLGTFVLEKILEFKNYPFFWESFPLLFFLLKITISIFLFAVFLQILKSVSFSHNGSFYSAASVLVLLVDVFISAYLNVSLTYYFLWAALFAFLFTIPHNRFLKLLFFLLSPIWIVKVAFELFTVPELDICSVLLFSRVKGNLLLAFFILPFMLMLMRLDFLFRHPVAHKRGFAAMLTFAFTGLMLLTMSAYILFYIPAVPRPLTVTETYDGRSHTIRFDSPAVPDAFSFRRGDRLYRIDPEGRSAEISVEDVPDDISIETAASGFMDRAQFRINISSGLTKILSIEMKLVSRKDIIVYDINFPFSLSTSDDTSTAVLYIGRYPPSPLSVEFTVPETSDLVCELTVTCAGLPEPWSVLGGNFDSSAYFIQKESFPLRYDPAAVSENENN